MNKTVEEWLKTVGVVEKGAWKRRGEKSDRNVRGSLVWALKKNGQSMRQRPVDGLAEQAATCTVRQLRWPMRKRWHLSGWLVVGGWLEGGREVGDE